MFDRLVHADWSVNPRKRWMAIAERHESGWVVLGPELVGFTGTFLDRAFSFASQGQRVLLGFDFPIGVPAGYGVKTGLGNFRHLLDEVGDGAWADFFAVSAAPADIRIHKPFYPATSKKGVLRTDLVTGLGASAFHELLRVCERQTAHRQAACSLFWTLGGNQVGKGALNGWKEVVKPALARGASLWPFDGTLAQLAKEPGVVLVETYPAEAYRMVNAAFRPGESKRRQVDRREKAAAVIDWAERHTIILSLDTLHAITDGFGGSSDGEDQFDAVMGLLKMLEVVGGRRDERTEHFPDTDSWEGWILGR